MNSSTAPCAFDQVVYLDSLFVPLRPAGTPGDSEIVSFATWTAFPVGDYTAKCSTALEGDANPNNDAALQEFRVTGHDVAARAILAPVGTVDSEMVITPRAVVENLGSLPETFDVHFFIAPDYVNTVRVTLPPGRLDTVEFADWVAGPVGVLATRCTVALSGDINPANNVVRDSVRVLPLTGIEEQILGLPDRSALLGARPNPCTDRTMVSYSLARPEYVRLDVFDISGKLQLTLVNASQTAGRYEAFLSRAGLARGIYVLRFAAGDCRATGKLVVE